MKNFRSTLDLIFTDLTVAPLVGHARGLLCVPLGVSLLAVVPAAGLSKLERQRGGDVGRSFATWNCGPAPLQHMVIDYQYSVCTVM